MNKDIGKLTHVGNQARTTKVSKERRKEIASLAAQARWAKAKHVCSDICTCICGFKKYQHTKYKSFECDEYKCKGKH